MHFMALDVSLKRKSSRQDCGIEVKRKSLRGEFQIVRICETF